MHNIPTLSAIFDGCETTANSYATAVYHFILDLWKSGKLLDYLDTEERRDYDFSDEGEDPDGYIYTIGILFDLHLFANLGEVWLDSRDCILHCDFGGNSPFEFRLPGQMCYEICSADNFWFGDFDAYLANHNPTLYFGEI